MPSLQVEDEHVRGIEGRVGPLSGNLGLAGEAADNRACRGSSENDNVRTIANGGIPFILLEGYGAVVEDLPDRGSVGPVEKTRLVLV